MFDAKLVEFELTLSDPVHEFDASDGRRGSSKMLEAEHRTKPQLDRSMVLFNGHGGLNGWRIWTRLNFGIIKLTGVCWDITERRRAQEQQHLLFI